MAKKPSRRNEPGGKHSPQFQHTRAPQHTQQEPLGNMASSYDRGAYGSGKEKHARNPVSGHTIIESSVEKYARNQARYSAKTKAKRKRLIRSLVSCLLILILAGGAAAAWYLYNLNASLNKKSDAERQELSRVVEKRRNLTEPFYMMLIGSDARDDGEEIGKRSDTNILARIDPTKNTVTLISIPRDTMITTPQGGVKKFNAAYGEGGVAETIREITRLTGIKVSNYAEIDFKNLIKLVDALGGVEVDVPETIDDPDAGPIVIPQGVQTLNGEAALVFARSRAYADGDFTRASNQRVLIQAIVDKILSLPPASLPQLMQEIVNCVSTDLSIVDIISLATQFQSAGTMTMYSAQLPSTTSMVDGVSYVVTDKALMYEMINLIEAGQDPNLLDTADKEVSIGSALSKKPNM